MLEQFIKSVMVHFTKVEPMNAYIQNIPQGVEYPCYLLNKCDVRSDAINSFYYMNNITLYIRLFGSNEIELKSKAFNLAQDVFRNQRKIPILNIDGLDSGRFIRLENGIETVDIPVDENEVYCVEMNFSFDTTHDINPEEFEILGKVYANTVWLTAQI